MQVKCSLWLLLRHQLLNDLSENLFYLTVLGEGLHKKTETLFISACGNNHKCQRYCNVYLIDTI